MAEMGAVSLGVGVGSFLLAGAAEYPQRADRIHMVTSHQYYRKKQSEFNKLLHFRTLRLKCHTQAICAAMADQHTDPSIYDPITVLAEWSKDPVLERPFEDYFGSAGDYATFQIIGTEVPGLLDYLIWDGEHRDSGTPEASRLQASPA